MRGLGVHQENSMTLAYGMKSSSSLASETLLTLVERLPGIWVLHFILKVVFSIWNFLN